jgi:hypothetical protein
MSADAGVRGTDNSRLTREVRFEDEIVEGVVRKPAKKLLPNGANYSRPMREVSKPVETISPRGTGNTLATPQDRGTGFKGRRPAGESRIKPNGEKKTNPVPRAEKKPEIDTLLISQQSSDIEQLKTILYNQAHFNGKARIELVDSWEGVRKVLSKYKTITNLVFLLHSRPGMFLFPIGKRFREKSLLDAAQELSALKVKPEITSIDFAGCNAGMEPDPVIKFGLALDAAIVTTVDHFHEWALTPLIARPGENEQLELQLLRLRGYITSPDLETFVEKAKKKKVQEMVLTEWYVATYPEHEMTLPVGPKVNTDKREKTFKKIYSAQPYHIFDQEKLDEFKADLKDLEKFAYEVPFRVPQKIIIHLDRFQKSNEPKDNAADAGR